MNVRDLHYVFALDTDEQKRREFVGVVDQVSNIALQSQWREVTNLLEDFKSRLTAGPLVDEILLDRAETIENLFRSAARHHLLLLLDEEAAKEYAYGPNLLGKKVAAAFPSAAFDLDEAAKCLALERYTAAVFHLMRVLESGLHILGQAFGVSTQRPDWQNTIDQVGSAIRSKKGAADWPNSTDWRADRESYAQMLSSLEVLKDAWRNSTAHARANHDAKDAHRILHQVEAFMSKLATRHAEGP